MVHSQTASTASADTSGPFLKPGWAPLNIFLMIVGFVLFWPLGLAMLGFNLWGHKLGEFKNDMKKSFAVQTDWMTSNPCLLYTSPSPRDKRQSRMPSSA